MQRVAARRTGCCHPVEAARHATNRKMPGSVTWSQGLHAWTGSGLTGPECNPPEQNSFRQSQPDFTPRGHGPSFRDMAEPLQAQHTEAVSFTGQEDRGRGGTSLREHCRSLGIKRWNLSRTEYEYVPPGLGLACMQMRDTRQWPSLLMCSVPSRARRRAPSVLLSWPYPVDMSSRSCWARRSIGEESGSRVGTTHNPLAV